jgi:hypothetical protein
MPRLHAVCMLVVLGTAPLRPIDRLESDMSITGKIAAWVYGLQAFLVLPWFLGAIYRQEQSLWVWEEYGYALRKHGQADAILSLYLYIIFYAAFFLIPYAALSLRFPAALAGMKHYFRVGRLILSFWFALTFFLFARPAFAFIRALPHDIWNGWLLILWLAATVFVSFALWDMEKVRTRRTRGTEESG